MIDTLGDESYEKLCEFAHSDLKLYWNQLRNNRLIPGVPASEISLVHPDPWDDSTIDALKHLLQGRVCFPPTIQGSWKLTNLCFTTAPIYNWSKLQCITFCHCLSDSFQDKCTFDGIMNLDIDFRAAIGSIYGVVVSDSCFNGAGLGLFCGKGWINC